MAAATTTFADFEDIHIRVFANILGINPAGATREQIFLGFTQINAAYIEDAILAQTVTAAHLRQWCIDLNLSAVGTRNVLVNRLYEYANPPINNNQNDGAHVELPKMSSVTSMSSLIKINSYTVMDERDKFESTIRSTCQQMAIWDIVEPSLNTDINIGVPNPSPEQSVRLAKLATEIKSVLSEPLQSSLDKEIRRNIVNDEPVCLWKHLRAKWVNLVEPQEIEKINNLESYTWKKSGLGFLAWTQSLKDKMIEVQDRKFPTQRVLMTSFKDTVLANCGRKVKSIANYIDTCKVKSFDADGYNIETDIIPTILSYQLTHIRESNIDSSNEKSIVDCFASDLRPVSEVEANLAKLSSENNRLKTECQNLKTQNQNQNLANVTTTADNTIVDANYTNEKPKSWCKYCEAFYKKLNMLPRKNYACRHLASQCIHNPFNKKGNNDNNNNGSNNDPSSNSASSSGKGLAASVLRGATSTGGKPNKSSKGKSKTKGKGKKGGGKSKKGFVKR